jgi:hypothetical protein
MMSLHAKDGRIIGHVGFEHETNAETSRSRLPGFAVRSHGVFVFFSYGCRFEDRARR